MGKICRKWVNELKCKWSKSISITFQLPWCTHELGYTGCWRLPCNVYTEKGKMLAFSQMGKRKSCQTRQKFKQVSSLHKTLILLVRNNLMFYCKAFVSNCSVKYWVIGRINWKWTRNTFRMSSRQGNFTVKLMQIKTRAQANETSTKSTFCLWRLVESSPA